MAHTFDTALPKPQRTALRDAILAQLAPLKYSEGLYLRALKGMPEPLGKEDADLIFDQVAGQTPAVLVALGRKASDPAGLSGAMDNWVATLDVYVYAVSQLQRGELERVAGDVVSAASVTADPGLETVLEHLEELLLGWQMTDASGSIRELRPVDEDALWHSKEVTIWVQQYQVRVQRDLLRHKTLTQYLTLIETSHAPDGADAQNPIIVADQELPPP
ncbi:MAG: hypothetical protein KC464_27635 [Myxococcales bacterium]|nr:hypothetical protein [Myxococcales bacterium]